MHDRAPYHRTWTVVMLLGANEAQALTWPANLVDLNPAKNVWKINYWFSKDGK